MVVSLNLYCHLFVAYHFFAGVAYSVAAMAATKLSCVPIVKHSRTQNIISSKSTISCPPSTVFTGGHRIAVTNSFRKCAVVNATGGASSTEEEGVSLGTMKLPSNTDLARFETLLFQWGNSLCQGANLPLDMPLKVDKIPGGARLGFTTIGDGKTEVPVYIDCLVYPGEPPMFRATRNGALKAKAPPGEPRIMRSLLAALEKCIQIARLQ